MIRSFQFSRLPLIIFGKGKRSLLPGIAGRYGSRIILVTRGASFTDSEEGSLLIKELKKAGSGILPAEILSEPSPSVIDQIVADSCRFNPQAVIAVGGGSVIDAGKAISAMLPLKEPIADFLEGVGIKEHPGSKIPFIAVPTTSGTGSEATKNAVISFVGKNGFKKSLRHENFVPEVAVVDPELTVSCPAGLTAASGMDCFTQLVEAYLSDKSNEYTDSLAMEGLKAVKSSLLQAYYDGSDVEARTGMAFAALTSGICLANAGLGIVHGFASSIGGMYNIPHGVICGTLMAASNELTIARLREKPVSGPFLKKYAVLGKLFYDEELPDDASCIDAFTGYLNEMTLTLELPGLKSLGIERDDLEKICDTTECKNNPVKLDRNDLMEILVRRFI